MAYKVVLRPGTRKGVVFVAGTPGDGPPTVTLASGKKVTAVRGDQAGGTFKNQEGLNEWQYVFQVPDSEFYAGPFQISFNGETTQTQMQQGAELRTENGGLRGLQAAPNKAFREGGGSANPMGGGAGYQSGSTFGGGFGGGQAMPGFVDASALAFQPVSIPQIPTPSYPVVDPRLYSAETAMMNRGEYLRNLGLAQQSALDFLNTETAGTEQFATSMSALQQQMVGAENAANRGEIATANAWNPSQITAANQINQAERDRALAASGLPIRDVITEGLTRARQLARGFLPTSIEDRAFEQAARVRAGDTASVMGLGTSSAMQNAIDKYTINERLKLAEYGSNEVDRYLAQGVQMLVDSPIKYNPLLSQPLTSNVSQGLRSSPSFSIGGAQQAETGNLSNLTTMSPGQAWSAYDSQRQFSVNTQNAVNQFNANMSMSGQQFNSNGNFEMQLQKLGIDKWNAMNAWQFAQNVANSINQQYQQQLANYANSVGQANVPLATPTATTANSTTTTTAKKRPTTTTDPVTGERRAIRQAAMA